MLKIFVLFFLLTISIANAQDTYYDTFSSVSYSNNDGTQNWSTNWIESGDDNSPSGGYIRITGNQLRFAYIWTETIRRSADLSAYSSATLSFDWQTSSLESGETLDVQVSSDGSSYTTLATFSGNQSGTFSQNISAHISSNTTIRFIKGGNNWSGNNDRVYIDNVLITATATASVSIADVSVNEGDGTATFMVQHVGPNATGAFTVNFTTNDGTAVAGSDYTASSGTLSFNGTSGDTESITVPINDDGDFEGLETFTVSFTGTSDGTINISDTATGSITDNDLLGNTPLALFEAFDGYVDYTSTGGTLRTQPNTGDACAITTSSSNTLTSSIPATATIQKALLYWAHSAATPDSQVTFEGNTVTADLMYTTTLTNRVFFGGVSDVTSIVQGISNPSTNTYDFTDLTVDNTGNYCSTATVLGGWSLFIFYEDASLPASTVNLYQGFNGESNSSSSFSLSGFFAIGASGSKTTVLSWEGDQTLSNNELLTVTTGLGTFTLAGDGDNNGVAVNNPFNSTIFDNTIIPNVNNASAYGLDLDTYDVSPYIQPGESTVTTNVQSGQDFVIMNALVLKVPSNLITGTVFEDVNYGGGAGRNRASSSGVGVQGATVELYDALNNFVDNTTTDANGLYRFGGMANGSYSVRVVNGTVRSTRGGGAACNTCWPVQTFRTSFPGGSVIEVTNEVGGADPSAEDSAAGTLTGAQSVAPVLITSEGVVGMDFGYNFNTIVNTNEDGQGSLEQFIVNANNLDEIGLDIVANSIFDPAAGQDTSIFMIPSSSDPLGRTPDSNFASGYFDIFISDGNPLSDITADNTFIDGRTQTAYSGDTNSGTIGAGGNPVGVSGSLLPIFELPEIQVHRDGGDVLKVQADVVLRNLSIYADNTAGIQVGSGSAVIERNLIGVNAQGTNSGNINYGIENIGGSILIDGNYIATNTDAGIFVNGGTTNIIQNNHITNNGNSACTDNILVQGGSGLVITQNFIENAASAGIDASASSGNITISENSITASGQDGGNCSGNIEGMAIKIGGNNSVVTNNMIYANGGAGIVVVGGTANRISQNSIYANGTISDALGIDLDASSGAGDGVTLNDNGDGDTGPNDLQNFPIISAAYISGSNLVVKGWSRPGATIEFFFTDINEGTATTGDNQLGMAVDYGEGQTFIGAAVEGSGADADNTSSSYSDVDGNTDNTNRFHFNLPVPSGATLGEMITATATLGNSTSEFAPMSILRAATVITNRRITYRVSKN
ncbi:Calx-beta domain-containing protein [Flagellimonas lutaonensis]|nr:Calx-beta domain-containing protein [Allomuricauda lutaonensis]